MTERRKEWLTKRNGQTERVTGSKTQRVNSRNYDRQMEMAERMTS